jgi:hypothetical protein
MNNMEITLYWIYAFAPKTVDFGDTNAWNTELTPALKTSQNQQMQCMGYGPVFIAYLPKIFF